MKPTYNSEFETGGVFLGTIRTLKGTIMDLWLCDQYGRSDCKTLVMRFGDEGPDYTSTRLLMPADGDQGGGDIMFASMVGYMLANNIYFN